MNANPSNIIFSTDLKGIHTLESVQQAVDHSDISEPATTTTTLAADSRIVSAILTQLLPLANSAAALFVDRHNTCIDINRNCPPYHDYLVDFNYALRHSGLNDVTNTDNHDFQVPLEANNYYRLYLNTMVRESIRLSRQRAATMALITHEYPVSNRLINHSSTTGETP